MLEDLELELTGMSQQDPTIDKWNPKVFNPTLREIGADWPSKALTMIGLKRLRQLKEACIDVIDKGVEGDFIETGIMMGCVSMELKVNRTIWGFDSFEGLPKPDPKYDPLDDQHHTFDELRISKEQVEESIKSYGLSNIKLVKGWFKDTLPIAPIEKIAILRLDGDMYESTIQALEALYPKLQKGGYCIIDDYALNGAKRAVHDYIDSNKLDVDMIPIDPYSIYWKVK
jgi:O-methyltransferase